MLEKIPDDIQTHILGFLDTNTKLKYLRSKYTSEFIKKKLQHLPKHALSLKTLYSCIAYVKPILVPCLNIYGRSFYREIIYKIDDRIEYAKTLKSDTNTQIDTGYFNCLVGIILSGFTEYERDPNREHERDLIKLLCYIKLL